MSDMDSRKTLLLGALLLVCVAAIARLGGSIYSFNKFRRTHLTVSSSAVRTKDPASYAELLDVDFSRLSEKQKGSTPALECRKLHVRLQTDGGRLPPQR